MDSKVSLSLSLCAYAHYIDTVTLLYDLIRFMLKFDHRREVSRNGIRSPNLCMDDFILRPLEFFNRSETSKTVFAVRQRQRMDVCLEDLIKFVHNHILLEIIVVIIARRVDIFHDDYRYNNSRSKDYDMGEVQHTQRIYRPDDKKNKDRRLFLKHREPLKIGLMR